MFVIYPFTFLVIKIRITVKLIKFIILPVRPRNIRTWSYFMARPRLALFVDHEKLCTLQWYKFDVDVFSISLVFRATAKTWKRHWRRIHKTFVYLLGHNYECWTKETGEIIMNLQRSKLGFLIYKFFNTFKIYGKRFFSWLSFTLWDHLISLRWQHLIRMAAGIM